MNISLALKKVRFEKDLQQQVVAKKAKISQTYLSQIEGGTKQPRKAIVERLCKVYGIPYIVLAWYGVEESDIKKDKLHVYKMLKPAMDGLVEQLLK